MVKDRSLLHKYQRGAVQFIKDVPQGALFMDMGLGKTVTTLTALSDLIEDFESDNVLIIAPKRVAFHTWPEELNSWDHIDISYTLVRGTPEKRWQCLAERTHIKIINIDLVEWLVDYYGKRWPFDTVIIDESSGFKDHSSNRFKALRKVCRLWDRAVLLTGTPAPNGLHGLWPQMYLIDRGERLGKTVTDFRNRHFLRNYNGYGYSIRQGEESNIWDKLTDVCVTLSAKDYLEMPDRVDNIINVDLPIKAQELYQELEKEFIAYVNDTEVIDAVSSAVLINKLLQLASGSVYYQHGDDEADRRVQYVHSAKLDALQEIIESSGGQPVLVAYTFQHERDLILQRFKQAEALDKEGTQIDPWNKSEVPILLVHPKSAGHGLNLQKGGHIAVWYSLTWSLELYQQFNARLHRQGQTKTVIIHHIMAKGTADQMVFDALGGKHLTQEELLNALKQNIEDRVE